MGSADADNHEHREEVAEQGILHEHHRVAYDSPAASQVESHVVSVETCLLKNRQHAASMPQPKVELVVPIILSTDLTNCPS